MKTIFSATAASLLVLLLQPTRLTSAAFPPQVAELMDPRVDPCDDFYRFSCGGWLQSYSLPVDRQRHNKNYDGIQDRNDAIVREILTAEPPLIGELYASCMDQATLDALGNRPLQKTLSRIASVASKKELFSVAGSLNALDIGFFTSTGMMPDVANATQTVFSVWLGSYSLPDRSYYLDPETATDVEPTYRAYVASVLELSGAASGANGQQQQQQQGKRPALAAAVQSVMDLERRLAEITPPEDLLMDPSKVYTAMSLQETRTQFPVLVDAYIRGNDALQSNAQQQQQQLTPTTKVLVGTTAFYAAAEALVAATDLATLKLYLSYLYTHAMVPYLGSAFANASLALNQKLSGVQALPPRSETCVTTVMMALPELVGQQFFAAAFDASREQAATEMALAIERELQQRLETTEWLDAATRDAALAKLSGVMNLIGHATTNRTHAFTLRRDAFLENHVTLQRDAERSNVARLGQRVDRRSWGSVSAAVANAMYHALHNKIVFPAGVLQPPFFSAANHAAQNFGAIGVTMGHELTHAFDSKGRRFDGDGNLRDWWTPATAREFERRAACMKTQFSAFPVRGERGDVLGFVNGNRTIGENIADAGGLSLAFAAYERFKAATTTTARAGQESVTEAEGDQLVFVAYAQKWCTKGRDSYWRQQLKTDTHAPGEWRTNGAAMNSDAFARVFRCPRGSRMNPETKCRVW